MEILSSRNCIFYGSGEVSLRTQNMMAYFGKEIKVCPLNKYTALSYFKNAGFAFPQSGKICDKHPKPSSK